MAVYLGLEMCFCLINIIWLWEKFFGCGGNAICFGWEVIWLVGKCSSGWFGMCCWCAGGVCFGWLVKCYFGLLAMLFWLWVLLFLGGFYFGGGEIYFLLRYVISVGGVCFWFV